MCAQSDSSSSSRSTRFSLTKTDLALRPIDHRWAPLPVLSYEHLAAVRSLDVVLPPAAGTPVRLRLLSRPERALALLWNRLRLPLPNRPKVVKNVARNSDLLIEKSLGKPQV
jgi:hypothetical protein